MPKHESHVQGLLIVDKPGLPFPSEKMHAVLQDDRLPTSHDIVQTVRRWTGQRRIGHTGTLDPMASGVLVLCLGATTRLVEYYQGHDKQYRALISLGAATDTYDATGRVTHSQPVPNFSQTQISTQLDRFRGEIMQVPPIYSAIKLRGESLHRKARRGEVVTPVPRQVTIYQLQLRKFLPPNMVELFVTCSAGTYIRSLANDLGRALGTFAHLARLRRCAVGPFTLAEAHTLASIEQAAGAGAIERCLLPPGYGLQMPELQLCQEKIVQLGYGQLIATSERPSFDLDTETSKLPKLRPDLLAQVSDADGNFVGVARYMGTAEQPKDHLWKAEKWFSTN